MNNVIVTCFLSWVWIIGRIQRHDGMIYHDRTPSVSAFHCARLVCEVSSDGMMRRHMSCYVSQSIFVEVGDRFYPTTRFMVDLPASLSPLTRRRHPPPGISLSEQWPTGAIGLVPVRHSFMPPVRICAGCRQPITDAVFREGALGSFHVGCSPPEDPPLPPCRVRALCVAREGGLGCSCRPVVWV